MRGNTMFDTILPDKLKISVSVKVLNGSDVNVLKQNIQAVLSNHFSENAYKIKLSETMFSFWITPTRYRTSPADNEHTDTNLIPPTEEELYNLFVEMGITNLIEQGNDSFTVTWLDLTKNTLVSRPVPAYIKMLNNRKYKGLFKPIDDSSNSRNASIVVSALKKDFTKKDITGTRKILFYDKSQQLWDKSCISAVTLRRPLTKNEIKMLPDGTCNITGDFIDLKGVHILRTELQYKQNHKLQYISQFITGNKNDKKLKLSTLLNLLKEKELYEKLEAYFTYDLKNNIFFDNPQKEIRLTSYDKLLLRLMKNQSATSLLKLYEFDKKLLNSAKTVINKIQKTGSNALYKELYLKLIIDENS